MMKEIAPRVEIDLRKIKHNAQVLKKLYGEKGIQITGVVKGVGASLEIAKTLIESGITSLADTKIVNLKRMRMAQLNATFMLIRTPALSEIEQVVQFADMSMNTEIEVIRALSAEAVKQHKVHSVILMVEMGDLREGIMPEDVPDFIRQVLPLPGIRMAGLGTNFACFGGIIPTEQKMKEFSDLVKTIQKQFSLLLPYVSGGNSANYQWFKNTKDVGMMNHIRLGESIFLGRETVHGSPIPGLYQDAFCLVAEVIESKWKPSVPFGDRGRNAFGETVSFKDRGMIRRAIVGIGRQDVLVSGLTPVTPVEILGSSSDHIILDAKSSSLRPGDEVRFSLNYGAMLSVMTSPYVYKKYLHASEKDDSSVNRTSA
ncbi:MULTISPECIES: alanine/ornithine racemase family PLP-dependent enzyme [Anoxybacillus]|jgi:ornithine racemase|uniref:Alanine/ornithine racemase family PLP-dependent enzyme n=1 Tax=Anoxybacteroides rupiense TaxID=311460 RepID=A0ABD5IWB2_9BACL|nr:MULTISPECIES: alanine/ornithine racemase family PLP-dependent enzyme [Anoxybacillus]MBS2772347.1 alanine/ornithine racemase family PLP-dependent enzyme [Anoxybacillus rupiensis]MDE8563965.1 alanine/ornithine racemase family PLP-dependent enzyme [Anoxybacillus rupiensis]MED5052478.1 alanine/ornithine racemase family PLP-dependent enzyme [Anoxybacillus rupiensis]